MRRFFFLLLIMIMIPYITTLAWTGRLEGYEQYTNGKVLIEGEKENRAITIEEYLISVLAAQIPADFEVETLKAQAIIARTYIYGLSENRQEIFEEELDMDALSTEQMKDLWGETEYPTMLAKVKKAVDSTSGLYLLYDGKLINPLFCYASAGITRSYGESAPYLKQKESPGDLLAEKFRSLPVFETGEFVRKINEIPGAVTVTEEVLKHGEGIQIVERDGSGYVKQVQVGQKTYTGEEIQYALGLASSCYSFEQLDGKIRVICKGIGHGYGFAQFGANEMAKEGSTYEELLKYYYSNVEIVGTEQEEK